MSSASFPSRILFVEDDPLLRSTGQRLLESRATEFCRPRDGFEGLMALKRSLPDVIISDLSMPNMNGFEFLFVVTEASVYSCDRHLRRVFRLDRARECIGRSLFPKGSYRREALFANRTERQSGSNNSNETVAVTCTECLRTFPVPNAPDGINEVDCDFCGSPIRFEIVAKFRSSVLQKN